MVGCGGMWERGDGMGWGHVTVGGGMRYEVRPIASTGQCGMVCGHVGCVGACGRVLGYVTGGGGMWRVWGGDVLQGVRACGRVWAILAGCIVMWNGVEACENGYGHMAGPYVKCQKVKDGRYERGSYQF